jgi:hypothetical protein
MFDGRLTPAQLKANAGLLDARNASMIAKLRRNRTVMWIMFPGRLVLKLLELVGEMHSGEADRVDLLPVLLWVRLGQPD